MTGSDQQGGGPRTTAAVAKAKEQMNAIAARSKVSVEELMTELRRNAARDFSRIHAQTRQEAFPH
jgi:F0F1-type ATP synthase membrane subunit b/b'